MSHPDQRPRGRRRAAAVGTACAALLTLATIPFATTASATPAAPVRASGAPPICSSSSENGRFVRWIYLMILNRCPDPNGGDYWTRRLDAGTDRWAFARTVDYSNENIYKNNVIPLYQGILDRAPSDAEAQAAAASIRSTESDGRLTAMIASSDEFYSHMEGTTPQEKDQAWLAVAYNGIVDRDPDPSGAAYYTRVLGEDGSTAATRLKVATALEGSAENARGWVTAVYGAALGRQPDPSGFEFWQHWLLTTNFRAFRMWTAFLSSNEAFNIAQTQPNPPSEPTLETRSLASF